MFRVQTYSDDGIPHRERDNMITRMVREWKAGTSQLENSRYPERRTKIITWLNDNTNNVGGLTRQTINELHVSAENIYCRFCDAWGHLRRGCHTKRGEEGQKTAKNEDDAGGTTETSRRRTGEKRKCGKRSRIILGNTKGERSPEDTTEKL